jgi:UDP-4-amino-4,6-dideoxy-N-acetyl-beta-L-altrosamine N-acetyltransferase
MIYLRALTHSDLENTLRWRQDPTLIHWLGEPFRHINAETEEAWFSHYLDSRAQNVRLVICEQNSGQSIGLLNLTGIHPVHRSAELSILIGEAKSRGKGYGRLAIQAGLKHAFEDLNLHRLELRVRADNLAAIHVYQATGFRQEGCLRKAYFKQGQYTDALLMGIVAEDYWK